MTVTERVTETMPDNWWLDRTVMTDPTGTVPDEIQKIKGKLYKVPQGARAKIVQAGPDEKTFGRITTILKEG